MHEELSSNQLSPIVINLLNGYGTLPSTCQTGMQVRVNAPFLIYNNANDFYEIYGNL